MFIKKLLLLTIFALSLAGLVAFLAVPGLMRARISTGTAQYYAAPQWISVSAPIVDESAAPYRNTESYQRIFENPFLEVAAYPLSTFAIDVDTASYSNVRRFLGDGQLPPKDAVRIEELINYFDYDYPEPRGPEPFSVSAEVADCPWNEEANLVLLGLQGRSMDFSERPPQNLVFLLDVSGSMAPPDKLPLLKAAMAQLLETLDERDRVAIVVYAGSTGLVLPPTPGSDKIAIHEALAGLDAGGSTAGGAGIQLAYEVAERSFLSNGSNRVILATDGDFNVGITSPGDLTRLIEEKRRGGVFLSVLGFGTGNLQDATMEQLADQGNGNYSYIDSLQEARKVLVHEAGGTFVTIAKDVKIQIELNPANVSAYRLIGYENRLLWSQDFNDDRKDAGELGAGHSVTALYEILPTTGDNVASSAIDALKYQEDRRPSEAAGTGELLTVKLRYKHPSDDVSQLVTLAVRDDARRPASQNLRFAAAVAGFGMLLRESEHRGTATFAMVSELARASLGDDTEGYRREFLELVSLAESLSSLPNYHP